MSIKSEIRISRRLAKAGLASRREAEKLILDGRVTLNGKTVVEPWKNCTKKDLLKLRKFVEKNFDYVGENFPSEVRKVYYDKKRNKNIYGTATAEEANELNDEGIDLTTIPWIDNKEN